MATAFTEERLSTAVGKIQVARGGEGSRLLYLHSATGEGVGYGVLEALAQGFEVAAPVFPGFAESEGLEAISDIEDAAFHVLDVLDVLGWDGPPQPPGPVVVGMSLGGWLAVEVATRWPGRVGTLVLVNPVGLHLADAPVREIFGREPGELAEDLFADQAHPLAQVMHQMGELAESGAELPFELVKPVLQSLAATAKVGWDPYLHNPKLSRRLGRVTSPTLVVHGAQDRLVPRAVAEAYATGIPGAQLVDVENAGHLLALERPDELARLVRDFAGG